MPHFFISTSDINQDIITISDNENFHHIAKVLRAKIGETLLLVDENRTQYKVEVKSIEKKSITTKVVETTKSDNILGLQLYLAQSVLKTDAQNLVVQKATELGIKGIIPLITDNSVIKPSVVHDKISKWQKIANEAVKQCERVDFLEIKNAMSLKEILESDDFNIKIACVEREAPQSLKACLQELKDKSKDAKIAVIIGPEGGFSAKEMEILKHAGIHSVSLGKLILRAETAVISALSNIIYELVND